MAPRSAARIRAIAGILERTYGPRIWRPGEDILGQLIKTILSQNTSDINSLRAFHRLRQRFPDWRQVHRAGRRQVADAIRSGGLADIKAGRIKAILKRIYREHPRDGLSFLESWPTDRIRKYLGSFPGVGEKTIACVLLFAMGRPVMPVDTHVRRVSQRLGLIPRGTDAATAHRLLQEAVPAPLVYAFHLHLIAHGRAICRARKPFCDRCPLRRRCPAYREGWPQLR
jgi:endonuclease-3